MTNASSLRGSVQACCLLCTASTGLVHGNPQPTIDEIVTQSEHAAYFQGDDGRARVEMTIKDSQGRERKRRMTILRRDHQGTAGSEHAQKYYVHIDYPSDLRNTVLTVWKHGGQDDDRWLYLPALDLVKRFAPGDKRTPFLGSDFFYEDISGRGTHEDNQELVETSDNYFVVKNMPKQADSVEFSHYLMWIHRATFIPVKAEFFDKRGEKYRVYDALAVETIQGHSTVVKSRMQDLRSNSQTLLEFKQVRYDLGVTEDVFTERYLRHPPKPYLN